ncbi:hypothetical protein [Deferribacter abyssi]|uniref:hypothetical protein n=1 Tax=Deferribacter abyssi TaxID=213806 RepID=UPI003C133E14
MKGLLIAALFLFLPNLIHADEFKVIYYRDCDYFVAKGKNTYCMFEPVQGVYPWESKKFDLKIIKNKKAYEIKYKNYNKKSKIYLKICDKIDKVIDAYISLCRKR